MKVHPITQTLSVIIAKIYLTREGGEGYSAHASQCWHKFCLIRRRESIMRLCVVLLLLLFGPLSIRSFAQEPCFKIVYIISGNDQSYFGPVQNVLCRVRMVSTWRFGVMEVPLVPHAASEARPVNGMRRQIASMGSAM
jgi:hypothetical protein